MSDGDGVSALQVEMVAVMLAQQWERTQHHGAVHLKMAVMINFVVHYFNTILKTSVL